MPIFIKTFPRFIILFSEIWFRKGQQFCAILTSEICANYDIICFAWWHL